jgi:hypothetical protein
MPDQVLFSEATHVTIQCRSKYKHWQCTSDMRDRILDTLEYIINRINCIDHVIDYLELHDR